MPVASSPHYHQCNGKGGTRNRKMSFLKFLLFCLFFKGVTMEGNIFGTPVDFFHDFISELNLDFAMIIKNSEGRWCCGILKAKQPNIKTLKSEKNFKEIKCNKNKGESFFLLEFIYSVQIHFCLIKIVINQLKMRKE